MSPSALVSCGIVLLTVVAIAWGGTFLLRVAARDVPTNALQRDSFRAGHAHAGVLVILGLVLRILTSHESVPAWADLLGTGVLWAAILMPAGFFLSVLGREPERRNGFRVLIGLGAASLLVGVVGAGVGLIVAGASA